MSPGTNREMLFLIFSNALYLKTAKASTIHYLSHRIYVYYITTIFYFNKTYFESIIYPFYLTAISQFLPLHV